MINAQPIEITEKDLPLHCPTKTMSQWNSHPRVFLQPNAHGHVSCPYCGTQFHIDPAKLAHAH